MSTSIGVSSEWVLLAYRSPREPSTRRIAVWRKLKRLGVAQLTDGLVGLPLDARNREQLEWVADEVLEAGGEAELWIATPSSAAHERALAQQLSDARAVEYAAVVADAATAERLPLTARRRTLARLRRELRRIRKRDYFPPPERTRAQAAVQRLAELVEEPA
ncbi:MAG: chromate resistance protein [Actinomycetota bacterium]|jgi:hypothetical protein|nr:chromate resistance protein [Actinomycetota bacterium]